MNRNNIDFNQIIKQVLPYFIEIYGEEYRDIIIERMRLIEPVFHTSIENQKAAMYIAETEKRIELTLRFLEFNNIQISDDLKKQILTSNSTYDIISVPEARDLLQACFDFHEYKENPGVGIKCISSQPTEDETAKKQSVRALKNFGVNVSVEEYNDWLSTDEAKQTFEKLRVYTDYISQLDTEFMEFDKQFDGLKLVIDRSIEISQGIREKYLIQFLQSIEGYMTSEDKKTLDDYVKSEKKDWNSFYHLKQKLKIFSIVGDSFYENGLIDAFSDNAETILNDPETTEYTRNSIIKNRQKYSELIDSYGNSLLMGESMESISDIIAKKELYDKLSEEEILIRTSSYQQNMDKINSFNLVTESSFTADIVGKGCNALLPNARIVDGKLELVPILALSPDGCLPQYIDSTIIHEINHAVELCLLGFKEENCMFKCGFETLSDGDDDNRKYTQFNEIMNQTIAMEITEAMHRDNVYLFDNPKTSKIKGGTSYEQQMVFIVGFWMKFRKEIIDARTSENMTPLFNIVGENNFNELNDIINEYASLPYYKMMNDIINGRETELSRKRKELIDRSIQVVNLMMENKRRIEETQNITSQKKEI